MFEKYVNMQSKRLGRRIRVYDVRARTTHYKRTDREVEEIENRETARERERERERKRERERACGGCTYKH